MKKSRNQPSQGGSAAPSSGDSSSVCDVINHMRNGNFSPQDVFRCRKRIENVSHTVGLQPDDIELVIELISEKKIGNPVKRMLISCLIPKDSVPHEAIIYAIGCVTSHQLSHSLEVALMKWICVIYSWIDDKELVTCLYAVLFPLLQYDLLQPYVCELLYKMTKSVHVVPYRVRKLIEVQSKMGPQPHLLALLQLYANYRPDLVLVHSQYKKAFKSYGKLPSFIAQVKEAAGLPVPAFQDTTQMKSSLMKVEIGNYSDLSNMMECFKGPIRISKLLRSPNRRVLFTSSLSVFFMKRLRMYIKLTLFTEFSWIHKAMNVYTRDTLLPVLSDISCELREGMPDVCTFISSYLKIWEGQNAPIIFNLISFWEMCPFNELFLSALQPLYPLFVYSPVPFMCSVLECLTNLLKHWVMFEIPRIQSVALTEGGKRTTVFEREADMTNPNEDIVALMEFINQLCQMSLQVHIDHPVMLLRHILQFYEAVLDMSGNHRIPLKLPSKVVMTALAFTSNPYVLSETCHLLCLYKDAVQKAKKKEISAYILPKTIAHLNGYIWDLCCMLSLNENFLFDANKMFQVKLPEDVTQAILDPEMCFALHRHPALLGHALSFAKGNIRVLSSNFDGEKKERFLEHLASSGLQDIVTFLKTFVSGSG